MIRLISKKVQETFNGSINNFKVDYKRIASRICSYYVKKPSVEISGSLLYNDGTVELLFSVNCVNVVDRIRKS
jgi:hypothetical protein